MAIRTALFVTLALAGSISLGCVQSCPRYDATQMREENARLMRDANSAKAGDALINHVVLIWLKKPGDSQARQALIDSGKELKTIPGVVDVRAGVMMPSTRPVVDSTYDVGLIITFTDKAALDSYAGHPTHVKLLNEVLKPNVDHYVVYDFKKP